jgi:GDP-mannose 6-dehydrogenase
MTPPTTQMEKGTEKMRISIFGLGYVGTVCAGCLASQGHTVVGVDISPEKLEAINAGASPIMEPRIGELIHEGIKRKTLEATASSAAAIEASDVSLICVGTPSQANGSLDLSYVARVCEDIGRALRSKLSPHVVVLRSTVLPGSTEELVIPTLEKHLGRKIGDGVSVCYNPEFLREGSSVQDFYQPPKIVIGERDSRSGNTVAELYNGIQAQVIRTSIRTAEMVKYADNAFHALKVTFANEMGNLCKTMGVDGHEVMSIMCKDTKLNLSPAYLRPGFAFGGSCLPKDLRALTYQAKRCDLDTPVLNAVLPSNSYQIKLAIEKLLSFKKKRIGFLGLSFKPETDDLRESPLVEVIETLVGKGHSVRIYDKSISLERLIGTNKRYIDAHLPHLVSLLVDTVDKLVEQSDVVVIGHRSQEFLSVVERLRPDQFIMDLVRIAQEVDTPAKYEGICW